MRILSVVLSIDDSLPVPEPVVELEVDGQPVRHVEPADVAAWFAVLDASAKAAGVDVRAQVDARLDGVVDRLKAASADTAARKKRIDAVLPDWQKAVG